MRNWKSRQFYAGKIEAGKKQMKMKEKQRIQAGKSQ
jgi:hypothetical protein